MKNISSHEYRTRSWYVRGSQLECCPPKILPDQAALSMSSKLSIMMFQERQHEEGEPFARKAYDEPVVFNWTVDIGEDVEVEKKKKIIKSPHFWVSGYEM